MSKIWKKAPGWYRGDFHLHTTASDGKYTPPELAALASEHGLDFFAITDHNSIGALDRFGEDSGLLIIPGIEVTLNEGHWNVFGMEGWRTWMEDVCTGEMCVPFRGKYQTITEMMEAISREGLLNSINHPLLKPWEWRDGLTDMRSVHCLEIWNDHLWPDNRQANPLAVALWTACLNAGYKITAIGGSDFHFLPHDTENYPGELPGLPATYVYAGELSGQAILTGLRRQQVYVSLGPQVTFQAEIDGQLAGIGADLADRSGKVKLLAQVENGGSNGIIQITKNGRAVFSQALEAGNAALSLQDQVVADQSAWYRVDVFDGQGQMLALTNPIFFNFQTRREEGPFVDYAMQALAS